ncbi:hypothetical protein NC651_008267 [Populus alba x Populus x berolinensis]|nr:hypothetical protein NC651_008267 [Populus alba x Populus x berolinensis]
MKKKGEGDKESERFAGRKETELRNEEVKSKERKENGYESIEGFGSSFNLCSSVLSTRSDVASLILEPSQAIF